MSSSTARRAVPPRTRSAAASSSADAANTARQSSTTNNSSVPITRTTRATTNVDDSNATVKQSVATSSSKPGLRTTGTRKRPALGDLTNAKRRERERLAALEREAKASGGKVQVGKGASIASSSKVGGGGGVATRGGGAGGVTGIRRPGAEVNGNARRGGINSNSINSRIGSTTNRRALASTNRTVAAAAGRGHGHGAKDGRVLEEDEEEDGEGYEVDTRETKRIKTGGNYADEPLEDDFVQVEEEEEEGPAKDEGWIDLDLEDIDDPLMVAEYVNDIFDYMKALELTTMPSGDYIEKHPDVTWDLRGVLVDWLIDTHAKFRLLPETLFLALNIVDRFLTQRTISLVKLQLVGITAMFIAAKYEEVICPSVQNFLYVADGGYNEEEILRAERYVLKVINFNLSYPNPMNFLRRISKADNYDIQTRTVAKYFMEISLVDYRLLEHPPSLVAAGAVWMAREVLERGDWSPTLVHYSSYSETELLATAEIMLDFILRPTAHPNFHKKYAGKKFMRASNYVVEWARGAFPEAAEIAKEEEQDLNTLLVDLYERQGLIRPGVDGISRASTVERESALLESGDFGSENEEGVESDGNDEEEEQDEEEEHYEENDEEEEEEEEIKPTRRGGRR